MHKKFELIIKIFIAATFFVPLIMVPSGFIFPFIVPKILVFRSLALLALGGYVLLFTCNWREYKTRLTAVNMAVGLFFVSFAISTFLGVDWYKSLWDNHERMLGLFTVFHYVVYYFVITAVIKEWRDWKWLLRIFLLAGMIVMIIGGMQKINPELLINRGSDRVSATLGNAIYFSGYGLFLFFIGLLLAIKEKAGKKILQLRSGQVFWFWYASVGVIFGLLGIFWGGTKGTLLGLLVAGLVLFVGYLLTIKDAKRIRLVLVVLLLLGLAGLGLLFAFRRSEAVVKIPVLGPLLNLSLASSTGETRVMAWQIAIEAWKEKPILGWGPNNYYYAFNKYYQPEFLGHGWGETWFDNAHSAIFNTLAVQGGIGLLFYFALFAVPIYSLWRGWKKGNIDKHVFVISSAFLAGHFVHNATVFENPTSYLYFFFFLAFVNTQIRNKTDCADHRSQITDKKIGNNNISIGLTVVVGLVVLILIYSTNLNPARANMSALQTLKAVYTNPLLGSEYYKNTARITSPHIDDIRSDFARSAMQAITLLSEKKYAKEGKDLFNLVVEELKKNLILHPLDIRIHMMLAQLYIQQAQIEQNAGWLVKAEEILQTALDLSSKRQQLQYMLSAIKLQLNKSGEAIKILQESINNYPPITEGWWRLALFYQQSGDIVKAKETVAEIRKRGMTFSGDIEKALTDIESMK